MPPETQSQNPPARSMSRRGHYIAAGWLIAVAGAGIAAFTAVESEAIPDYFFAWRETYPDSTLPAQLSSLGLSQCFVCHHPNSFSDPGTCYRLDIRTRLQAGDTIEQALAAVEQLDSDNDGATNIQEILFARSDTPGQIGYHPGLAGPTGNDPCWKPTQIVTNRNESPCLADYNADGTADFFDYLDFVAAFSDSTPAADFNRDRTVDFFDYLDFVSAFSAGCPV
jgi:hypothetical protein